MLQEILMEILKSKELQTDGHFDLYKGMRSPEMIIKLIFVIFS